MKRKLLGSAIAGALLLVGACSSEAEQPTGEKSPSAQVKGKKKLAPEDKVDEHGMSIVAEANFQAILDEYFIPHLGEPTSTSGLGHVYEEDVERAKTGLQSASQHFTWATVEPKQLEAVAAATPDYFKVECSKGRSNTFTKDSGYSSRYSFKTWSGSEASDYCKFTIMRPLKPHYPKKVEHEIEVYGELVTDNGELTGYPSTADDFVVDFTHNPSGEDVSPIWIK